MATTITPPAGATNAELVRWTFDVLNEHDITPLRSFWSDATVERFPQGTRRGADEIAAYFEETFAALPDFHMNVVALAEQGDDVFVRWHLTATHTGAPFFGIAPSGKQVAIDGMDHFVVRDGGIVSNFVIFDQMQFARQIGMLPEDGTPGDRVAKAAFGAKTRLTERLRRI